MDFGPNRLLKSAISADSAFVHHGTGVAFETLAEFPKLLVVRHEIAVSVRNLIRTIVV